MDALLLYRSEDEASDSDQELDDARPLKRCKGPDGAPTCVPAGDPAARPAPTSGSLLPPAAALLDGSYSPPPAAQQRELERMLLHQGRTRTFPHIHGSFPTHVYIEVPVPSSCLGPLGELLSAVSARLPALQAVVHAPPSSSCQGAPPPSVSLPAAGAPQVPAHPQELYHVSLSRTVPVRQDQIEPLVESLRRRLRQHDTFSICMGRPEVLVNDEGSRTFLALAACCPGAASSSSGGGDAPIAAAADGHGGHEGGGCALLEPAGSGQPAHAAQQQQAQQGGHEKQQQQQQVQQGESEKQLQQEYSPHLVALCHAVSSVFASHGLPRFHAVPRPHASVAWLLGNEEQQLQAALAAPGARDAAKRLAAQDWQVGPGAIVCKAGGRPYTVWQAAEHDDGARGGAT
ncbi:hypothetical protein ABPG77_006048 [Micractinium sp. CCAP 211/92]